MKDYDEMSLDELRFVLPFVEGERMYGYHSDEDIDRIVRRIRKLEREELNNVQEDS